MLLIYNLTIRYCKPYQRRELPWAGKN